MKTKKSAKKVNLLTERFQSLVKKSANAQSDKTKQEVDNLQSEMNATIALQKEITDTKSLLKSKQKDLALGIEKLDKNSKKIKKDLKSEIKGTKALLKEEKQKKVSRAKPDPKGKGKSTKARSVRKEGIA
ncbi:MAG: hypothetical protein JW731_06180 [Bacteroidales bacterium]|nr:hypothetical protein [Bacteroidales bacterium]